MEKLSIEQKAERYDKAIKVAKSKIKNDKDHVLYEEDIYDIFPVLKENKEIEDEKIREQIVYAIKQLHVCDCTKNKLLAWLEKQGRQQKFIDAIQIGDKVTRSKSGGLVNFSQLERVAKSADEVKPKFKVGDKIHCKFDDRTFVIKEVNLEKGVYFYTQNGCGNDIDYADEMFELVEQNTTDNHFTPEQADILDKHIDKFLEQKPIDKVEPKFKVGDWVVNNNGEPQLSQVISYSWPDSKIKRVANNLEIFVNKATLDKRYHLWTIQDAKDGDVLADDVGIIVFRKIGNEMYEDVVDYHCVVLHKSKKFEIQTGIGYWGKLKDAQLHPATKEQRDVLMKAMADAGYTFDFEKKELKKNDQELDEKYNEWYGFIRWFVKQRIDDHNLIPSSDDIHKWSDNILNHARKVFEQNTVEWSLPYGKNETAEKLIALAECLEMDGDCLFNGLSGNDYGAFLRALAIELTEVKPADKVEPKFHEGDWIVHQGTKNIYQVVAIIDNQYQLKYGNNYTVQQCAGVDRCARLWDITKDAKKGDILRHNNCTFIFICIEKGVVKAFEENLCNSTEACNFGEPDKNNDYNPATKEQRDLLLQKIKNAGYEWDAVKKELKKIKQNPVEEVDGEESFCSDEGKREQDVNIQINPSEYINDMGGNGCYLKNTAQASAWSEEDGIRLQRIIDFLWHNRKGDTDAIYQQEQDIDWLKSIKSESRYKQEEAVLRWESGHPEPYKSVLILKRGNVVVEGEWNEETGRWYQYGFQSYLEDNEVDGWMNKKSLLSSFNFQHHWKPSDLPHWKKSALPDDDTTGFNSVNFCYNGYYINYRELFNKLPKDD